DRVDVDVVAGVPAAVRGVVLADPGHRPAELEYGGLRDGRGHSLRVADHDVDDLVGELRELQGLPVVVPAVGDGRVEEGLLGEIGLPRDEVGRGGAEAPEWPEDLLAPID